MEEKARLINLQSALRLARANPLEFWRNNGNGTCTRVSDGLTLTHEQYDALPARSSLAARQRPTRLQ